MTDVRRMTLVAARAGIAGLAIGLWLDPKTAFAKDGLLDELKKAFAERALNAEMDHHLTGDGGAGNSRNGYGRRSVLTDTGQIELEVPRGIGRRASTRS